MIHSWKMMKLNRCNYGPYSDGQYYIFPNGITVEYYNTIRVNIEFSGLVESLLKGWKYNKKMNRKKGEIVFKVEFKDIEGKNKVRGDFEDLWWELYSLEID